MAFKLILLDQIHGNHFVKPDESSNFSLAALSNIDHAFTLLEVALTGCSQNTRPAEPILNSNVVTVLSSYGWTIITCIKVFMIMPKSEINLSIRIRLTNILVIYPFVINL